MYNNLFITNLTKSLKNKHILIDKIIFSKNNNNIHLNVHSFFRYKKIRNYKKKTIVFQKQTVQTLNKLLKNYFMLKTFPSYTIKITNLNQIIQIKKTFIFFKTFKRFKDVIFIRRPDLFSDFLNLSSLIIKNKISSKLYLVLLGQLFNNLLKKKHGQFFLFLKLLFKKLICQKVENKYFSAIKGIKFVLSGKLKGKPRASKLTIIEGKVPGKQIPSNIQYNKLHVYNRYGAYGLKFWLNSRKDATYIK